MPYGTYRNYLKTTKSQLLVQQNLEFRAAHTHRKNTQVPPRATVAILIIKSIRYTAPLTTKF